MKSQNRKKKPTHTYINDKLNSRNVKTKQNKTTTNKQKPSRQSNTTQKDKNKSSHCRIMRNSRGRGVRLTTQACMHSQSRARTHMRTYSKRCNGLINNASALHVYAIYRARPSGGQCRSPPQPCAQAYHRQSSDASVHTESACREKG